MYNFNDILLTQEFACVSGTYPVDEECSDVAMQFWEYFLVCFNIFKSVVLLYYIDAHVHVGLYSIC